jgi:hypothetical protein
MKKPSAVQVAYWEAKLKRYGLTEDRGRVSWIDYGHKVIDLDFDGRIAYRPPTDKTAGESSEREWPQSMC